MNLQLRPGPPELFHQCGPLCRAEPVAKRNLQLCQRIATLRQQQTGGRAALVQNIADDLASLELSRQTLSAQCTPARACDIVLADVRDKGNVQPQQ